MSELRVDKIVSSSGSGSVEFTEGIIIPGGAIISGIAQTAQTAQTAQSLTSDVNINTSGIITASSFVGSLTGTATTTTNIPNLTGDITSVNTITTLATVNSDVGTFGSSTTIPSITVNAKGLVTGVSTSAITVGDGTLTLSVSGTGLSGSQTFSANQSGNATFTVTSNATDSNTPSTLVSRDSSGGFNAGIITATSIVKSGGTSSQFLKADGSVDSNTYLTSYTETDTLDDVTSRGNTTSNGISVGFITATNLTLSGDLTVNGNTTTINSTTLTVDDKNIVIASGAANDAAADGGGITLESGDGDKTLNWINATDSWTSSENLDLASGKTYKINTAEVLSSTTLGSSVINSSLTSVGTLGQLNVSGVTTASSFVKSGGTSSQFLKADGSVDSNTYLTSYTETDTLDDVTSRGNTTSNGISVGVLTATSLIKSGGTSSQFLKADGSVDSSTYATTTLVGLSTSGLASETYVDSAVGLSTSGLLSSTGSGATLSGIVTSITAGTNITIDQSTGNVTINAAAGGGGGSGEFNTGITSSVQITPLSYETSAFTFPATSGRKYIIESINVANVAAGNTEVNIIASIDGGEQTYIAYNVPIVSGGAIELLKEPMIANPSDALKVWATDYSYVGTSTGTEMYLTYTEKEDTDYFVGAASTVSIATTDPTTVYTSTTYPSVIQSIHLANRTDGGDYPISVSIANGITTTYIAKDMIVPRYATVELLERPKRIEANGEIKVEVGQTSTVDVIISGKQITS